jgi:hypothetical protein
MLLAHPSLESGNRMGERLLCRSRDCQQRESKPSQAQVLHYIHGGLLGPCARNPLAREPLLALQQVWCRLVIHSKSAAYHLPSHCILYRRASDCNRTMQHPLVNR